MAHYRGSNFQNQKEHKIFFDFFYPTNNLKKYEVFYFSLIHHKFLKILGYWVIGLLGPKMTK